MSPRREKSERHVRLDFTQPADLPPPAWIQPSRRALFRRAPSIRLRLLIAVLVVCAIALTAALWPGAHQ
jgi:hypothetical protein